MKTTVRIKDYCDCSVELKESKSKDNSCMNALEVLVYRLS